MKRALAIVAGITLAFSSSACFLDGSNEPVTAAKAAPGGAPEAHEGLAWKLGFAAQCAAGTETDRCLAAHGFSVSADGRYQVGPGPQGQVLAGTLSAAELKGIDAALTRILDAIHPELEAGETCATRSQLDTSETITFNRRGHQRNIIHTAGTEFCFRAPSQDDAHALHAALAGLARRYYPVPFPDPCIGAVVAVHAHYAGLGECATDADCTYLDSSYAPIPDGELQFVPVDDCSLVSPLPVANAAAAEGAHERILFAREQARVTCSARLTRISCEAPRGFQATEAPPVCIQGSCRIHPSIQVP
jgi:hypothetical protein